jgi:hypothetical protein
MEATLKFFQNGALLTLHKPATEGELAFDDQYVFTDPARYIAFLGSLWPVQTPLLTDDSKERSIAPTSTTEQELCTTSLPSSSSTQSSASSSVAAGASSKKTKAKSRATAKGT